MPLKRPVNCAMRRRGRDRGVLAVSNANGEGRNEKLAALGNIALKKRLVSSSHDPGGFLFESGVAHACSCNRPSSRRWMHLRNFRCSKDSLATARRNLRWQAVARTWNFLTPNFPTSGEISFIFRPLAISLDSRDQFFPRTTSTRVARTISSSTATATFERKRS